MVIADYIYGYDERVAKFVADMIPTVRERGFGRCKAIGVIDHAHQLIAGFVYHNYDPDAQIIQISGAALPGARWCTQKTLAHIYCYPFLQLGCQMIVQMVPANDQRLLRQLAALNYKFILLPRVLGRDKDCVLAQLTYEDWVSNKICQRYKHHIPNQPIAEAAE